VKARLVQLVGRYWPAFKDLSPHAQSTVLGDLLGIVYSIPLLAAALIWLVASTWLPSPEPGWLFVALIIALHLLFNSLQYTLAVELAPGLFADSDESLASLVLWSGALIVGPAVFWAPVIYFTARYGSGFIRTRSGFGWPNQLRHLVLEIPRQVLAGLIGLAAYNAWGGDWSPSSFTAGTLLPALGATLVRFLVSSLIYLPLFVYITRQVIRAIASQDATRVFIRFLGSTLILPSLVDPFAIFAAVLYGRHSLWVYLAFVGGALLVGLLARRLSQTAERSRARTREMEQLEKLGRAIIEEPPDTTRLGELLEQYIPGMFGFSGIEIRLRPDQMLLHFPDNPTFPQIEAAFWEWAWAQPEARAFLPRRSRPWTDERPNSGVVYVPIHAHSSDELIGGIYIVRAREASRVEGILPAALTLADQVASAIHSAEVYRQTLEHHKVEQELAFAGRIQASFLPPAPPEIPGWEIAVGLEPARQTSGDFYDLISLPGGRIGLVVADVADKGTGAALYMALSRTLIRTFAFEHPDNPELALRAANERILQDTTSEQFVTVFYGVIDPSSARLAYCSAGHNPGFLISPQPEVSTRSLPKTGLPLGILETYDWKQEAVAIRPGDLLVVYSDGVTEAENNEGAFFGEDGLLEAVESRLSLSVDSLHKEIVATVRSFAEGVPQGDDITLALIRRRA
jgi:serine phosphatase RsbU (regulator of sigma subunit)